jgi:hypothetical protein
VHAECQLQRGVGSAVCCASIGHSSVNVVPSPSTDATETVALIVSMNSRTMERPRPRPWAPSSPSRDSLTRTNRSKIVSRDVSLQRVEEARGLGISLGRRQYVPEHAQNAERLPNVMAHHSIEAAEL